MTKVKILLIFILFSSSSLFSQAQIVTPSSTPRAPLPADVRQAKLDQADKEFRLGVVNFNQNTNASLKQAEENFESARKLFAETGQPVAEGACIFVLAKIAKLFGNYETSLDLYKEVEGIFLGSGDSHALAVAKNNKALVYYDLGQTEKSLDMMYESLFFLSFMTKDARKEREDEIIQDEGTVLQNIAGAYVSLGKIPQAMIYTKLALEKRTQVDNKEQLGMTYMFIGTLVPNEAVLWYTQALGAFAESEKELVSKGLNKNSGKVGPGPTNYLKEAFKLTRQVIRGEGEASVYLLLAYFYLAKNTQDDNEQALDYLHRALSNYEQIGDKSMQVLTLGELMRAWNRMGNPNVAVFYGKRSVNLLQELRLNVPEHDPVTKSQFIKSEESIYRDLAEILVLEKRFVEAEQVMDMLKEEVYGKQVARDASVVKNFVKTSKPAGVEKSVIEKYKQLVKDLALARVNYENLLTEKIDAGPGFSREAELVELHNKVLKSNEAFHLFLKTGLALELPRYGSKKHDEESRNKQMAIQDNLQKSNAASLYTITTDDGYRVVLTTSNDQVDGERKVTAKELDTKIFDFRRALKDPSVDPRCIGKELYDILIGPIETKLNNSGTDTLFLSLDGVLNYIPIGALWDGKQYLIEKYKIVILTSNSREIKDVPGDTKWRILGAGVTKSSKIEFEKQTYSYQGYETNELFTIIDEDGNSAGYFPGKKLLDDNFTPDVLESEIRSRNYNVAHFATHFELRMGGPSFLLLGKNQFLTRNQIISLATVDKDVFDLIVLSACDTAVSDVTDDAANGVYSLATIVAAGGAKAVIATLWGVENKSTSSLMIEFYKQKKINKITKAEALRQAQLSQLYGPLGRGKKESAAYICKGTPDFKDFFDPSRHNAHPYYWSPFILIGDGQ